MTEKLTPLQEQYNKIKAQHPDKILFFRMGDFYEMFGHDAELAAPVLGIALTSRAHGKANKIPLAGVPYHAAEKYLAQLLKAGFKVAICEQTEDPKLAKGLVKRDVVEIITPGTITVDGALTQNRENIILSLYPNGEMIGLAALELTTGRLLVYQAEIKLSLEKIETLQAAEMILPESSDKLDQKLNNLPGLLTKIEDWKFNHEDSAEKIKSYYKVQTLNAYALESLPLAVSALGGLISYVEELKFGIPLHLNPPRLLEEDDNIYLDNATINNLELLRSQTSEKKEHSLLGLLDFCKTAGGKRLLARWLSAPLKKIELIKERHEVIEAFLASQDLKQQLIELLTGMADLERLSGKLGYRKASPKDLIQLKESLKRLPKVKETIQKLNAPLLQKISGEIPLSDDLVKFLEQAIVDDPPYLTNKGKLIKKGYSDELDKLKFSIKDAVDYIGSLQNRLRKESGVNSLKVGYNRVFGYYIEVSKAHKGELPENFIRKQTLVNAERYITPEIKEKEEIVLAGEEKINRLEEELFQKIREHAVQYVKEINLAGQLISTIDTLYSFAAVSERYNYIRPEINSTTELKIIEGRHPVIEQILPKGDFVSNNTYLDTDEQQIQLLTGPNMAGKSTYLRQVGLIVIMAQAGCYVPAEHVEIGIVDRVFTRVGASDRLTQGESTFLVEMNETSGILNNATKRSLILLDEVGRGTSTYDGLSIAWALCEMLHEDVKLGSRTIFATHFHELTALADTLEKIKNYQVKVRHRKDKIIFLRKVIAGGCDDSFGIEVAKLAGIPAKLTDRAKEILRQMEMGKFDPLNNHSKKRFHNPNQLGLFAPVKSITLEKLGELEPDNMTPLEALTILIELKKEAERESDNNN